MKKLIAILFLFASFFSFGQNSYLKLDTNKLRIGEQTILRLYFEYKNPNGKALIIWPEFDEQLTKNIEIVDKSIDKESLINADSALYKREQQLLITAFEPGKFEIPAQEIRLGDSVYYSNTATIFVETVEVDTSKGLVDIKPIYSVKYPFSERSKDWLLENWYWIVLIIVLILIFIIWRYVKNRKNNQAEEEEILEEIIPAHILALETLLKLKEDEKWRSTEKKAYYSELTDTVRTYLENRFNIRAMEQTTREIIGDLKYASITEDDKVYLRKILREADKVKFAKFAPNDEDAFAYLNKSIDFVKRTKEKESE